MIAAAVSPAPRPAIAAKKEPEERPMIAAVSPARDCGAAAGQAATEAAEEQP